MVVIDHQERGQRERERESYGRAVRDGNFILKNVGDDC